ncbi:MAG: hypothetical protein KF778_02945 [Rhodocyclaceae bacterium]|nr:hypothetical protein [Rhodocyclaceae bacterium]
MSGFGAGIAALYDAASDAAKAAATKMMSSAAEAAKAVRDAAVTGAQATSRAAAATGRGVANVAGFAARAAGEAANTAGRLAGSALASNPLVGLPYQAARQVFSPASPPQKAVVEPCPNTWEGKKKRLEQRQGLIANGRNSDRPELRKAADRLARNNEAVELAKLSSDSYDMYPPQPGHEPPVGWTKMGDAELVDAGIDPSLLKDSRAVVYKTAPDWPGGQKTVLAFRGTADLEDGLVDHDQAMGLPTRQYEAAVALGTQVSESLGPDVLVTGHSLGGGKAQAAGAVGGLKGTMFNSAGLNPASVGGAMPDAGQFQQYRTPYDPLTGTQNSPLLQTAVATLAGVVATPLGAGMKAGDAIARFFGAEGMPPDMADYADKAAKSFPRGMRNLIKDGNVMPPAVGKVIEVPAISPDGKPVPGANPLGQHSIDSVVNGIEQQKTEDISTLS